MNSSFYIPPPYPFPDAWPCVFASDNYEKQNWLTPTTWWMNSNTSILHTVPPSPTETIGSGNFVEEEQSREDEQQEQATYRVSYTFVLCYQ